jgi:hypothetical protein
MIAKAVPFLIAAIAYLAPAQTNSSQSVEMVYPFTHVDTPQWASEVVYTMRTVVDVKMATLDSAGRTLTLGGTADQIALAGWLLPQLDTPVGQPPLKNPNTPEYRLGGSSDDLVRVIHLAPGDTPQASQEMVNLLRSILEIQRSSTCNPTKSLILRGTSDQIAVSQWIVNALDQPASARTPGPAGLSNTYTEVRTPPNPAAAAYIAARNAVRIFFTNTPNPQASQEIVNSLRSIIEIQRVVTYNPAKAIVLRATPGEAAMAEWMIAELDKPGGSVPTATQGQTPAANQYPMPGSTEVAGIFYIPYVSSPVALQDAANQIRSTLQIQRVVACNLPQALTIRGTTDQLALAQKLIQDRSKM